MRVYQGAANRIQAECPQQATEGFGDQRTQRYATLGGALFGIFEEPRGEGDRGSHNENDSTR